MEQGRMGGLLPMCTNRVIEKLKKITTSLSTRGNDGPDPFAPLTARFTSSALSDAPVNDHKPNRLFRQVIRGLNRWRGDELEVLGSMLFKAFRHIPGLLRVRNLLSGLAQQGVSALFQGPVQDG